jgi:hypothetical protein
MRPALPSRCRQTDTWWTPRIAPDGNAIADIERSNRPASRCRWRRTLTLILPETIGNVTVLTAGKRVDVRQLLVSKSTINYLEKIMSKERKSNREDKKQPAMTPKEKKAAKKSRKEARGILGEHGG